MSSRQRIYRHAGDRGDRTAQRRSRRAPAFAADKLGVSMPNIKGPWFTPVLLRHHRRGEEARLRRRSSSTPAATPTSIKQVTQLSNLIVQKVNAILMDPANPASFNGVVRQAKAAKIPVVGAGSPIVASGVEADAAASSSHCNIGHELAKGAKTLLPNGGTVAILAGPPGAFWASDRLRCFKEDLAGGKIKIVAEQTSEQDAATALVARQRLPAALPQRRHALRRRRHLRRRRGARRAGRAEVRQGEDPVRGARRGGRRDDARRLRRLRRRPAAGADRPHRRRKWRTSSSRASR